MKKVFACIAIILSMFVCVKVSALNIDDYKFKVNLNGIGSVTASIEIVVEGDFKSKTEDNGLINYYVKFVSNENDKPTVIPTSYKEVETSVTNLTKYINVFEDSDNTAHIGIHSQWYMLDGYEYVYLLKCTSSECEMADKPAKIDRPALPALGSRYKVYIFEEYNQLSVFPLFPFKGEIATRKICVKVDKITDNDLLYKIYKKQSGAVENLIEYAKKDSGTIFSGVDEIKSVSLDDFDVINGAYYYIYTYYDNPNGLYRDLGDVTVAMGKYNILSNDVTYNFTDENISVSVPDKDGSVSDEDIKNPSTADLNIYAIVIALITCVALIFVSKKKLNKNK